MTIARYTRMPTFADTGGILAGNKLLNERRMYRSFVQSDSTNIYPTLDGDWQVTNDFNGVAYPSGLKQIRYKQTWNIDDVAVMNAGTKTVDYIIAVPDTLPAGYTVSTMRFEKHRRTLSTLAHEPFYGQVADLSHVLGRGHLIRIPSTQGIEFYNWGPDAVFGVSSTDGNRGNGVLYHNSTLTNSTLPTSAGRFTGMRYMSFSFNKSFANPAGNPLNWKVELYRSNTAAYSAQDHVLYSTGAIAAGAGTYSSGVLLDGTAGNFQSPTLGTLWQFRLDFLYEPPPGGSWLRVGSTYPGVTNPASPDYLAWLFNAGPRLDVPVPWLVTGDDMALPGGIVTGAITGF